MRAPLTKAQRREQRKRPNMVVTGARVRSLARIIKKQAEDTKRIRTSP
ncbi:hypothetical protein HZA86_03205 [Candidatus Uhrbacteria bacterium]|nr:hypothetical protein [Candidatus Uhrbacteria bacterium]